MIRKIRGKDDSYQTHFSHLTELKDHLGEELGLTPWMAIDQERVNQFAEATGDDQWIHVDRKKAIQNSPFPGTIAHGFLILSLAPRMCYDTFLIDDAAMVLNYGLDRVRFPQAVLTGSRVRGRVSLAEYEEIPGGARFKVYLVVEVENLAKPACYAELWSQVYVAPNSDTGGR